MSSFLSDKDFNQFKEKIYDESGIHFSAVNRPILESRIKERLRVKKIETPQSYYELICGNRNELDYLLDSVTTNLTNFFRNDTHFEALSNQVLPEIIQRKTAENKKKIKVWSAGCSTGEEPYSIAIAILERLSNYEGWHIDILASDISLKSLIVAKEGFYNSNKVENVKPDYLLKYFDEADGGYQIKDAVKSLCRFDYHNLKFDNGERDIDIIFCRNVIIYFDRTAQLEVIKKFSECSNEEGYLFIGHSESLFGMETSYKFHKIGKACVYRMK